MSLHFSLSSSKYIRQPNNTILDIQVFNTTFKAPPPSQFLFLSNVTILSQTKNGYGLIENT